jgi:hypothetical protein
MFSQRLILLAFVLSLSAPRSADAKCAPVTYTITVSVYSEVERAPVSDARVAFFANGSSHEELKRRPEGNLVAVTASDGGVNHDFWFNTYSGGGLRGDRCEARVKSIEVVVHHPDYAVRLLRFDVSSRTSRRGERLYLVTLPNIELRRLNY